MADNIKVVDKNYLLKQLRKLIGKLLYEDTVDYTIVSTATGSWYITGMVLTTYTYYKYTGVNNGIEVKTADLAANYTTLCGLTIIIGDKVRPTLLITEDNINRYIVLIPELVEGNLIKPNTDCWIVSNDITSPVYITYLNACLFQTDNVAVNDFINFTPDEIQETVTTLKRIINDIRQKKLSITDVTKHQYFILLQTGSVLHNHLYNVVDEIKPTCWLNGQNILGGGGIDVSGAEDGQFLVYSSAQGRPVWITVSNLDRILF